MHCQQYFTRRKHYASHTLTHTLPSRIKFPHIRDVALTGVFTIDTLVSTLYEVSEKATSSPFVHSASYLVVARLWSRLGSAGRCLHWFSGTFGCIGYIGTWPDNSTKRPVQTGHWPQARNSEITSIGETWASWCQG